MKWIILLSCVVAYTYAATDINPDAELPELTICDARDTKRDECLFKQAEKLLAIFGKGLPSFNIPSMDPYHRENDMYEFKNGFLFGQMVIKSVDSYGLSKAIFKKIKTQIRGKNIAIEFNVVGPEVFVEGSYKGKGEFNGLKVHSKGYFNISMSNVDVTTKCSGKFIERDGEKYLKIMKADMIPKVGGMKIFATGLFPDPVLNEFVLNLANQYWNVFYEAMLPDARLYWEPMLIGLADKVTLKIPARRLIVGI